jgi:dinuclear metal center YbgI/SA1388 family protein
MLSVDVTSEVVAEAIDSKIDLLIAHHPFLLRGVNSVSENTAKGRLLSMSIRAGLAIYSAHTNADVVEKGVSDELARRLGVEQRVALAPFGESVGLGRIGRLGEAVTLGSFARLVANVLPPTASGVRVAGDFDQMVERIAVCGGAGDSLLSAALSAQADVFVTADLRHHPVQDAREFAGLTRGTPAIIDVSHWASEWLWLEVAAGQLQRQFEEIEFSVSDLRTDPWDFVITQ